MIMCCLGVPTFDLFAQTADVFGGHSSHGGFVIYLLEPLRMKKIVFEARDRERQPRISLVFEVLRDYELEASM